MSRPTQEDDRARRIAKLEERLAGDLDPFVRRDLEDELVRLLSKQWEDRRVG